MLVMTRFLALLGVTLVYVSINLQNYLIMCSFREKHRILQKGYTNICTLFLKNTSTFLAIHFLNYRVEITVCY